MMNERDQLLSKTTEKTPMYIVVPTPMMAWVVSYREQLANKEYTVLIPSCDLNPEPVYYYQNFDFANVYKGIEPELSRPLTDKCEERSFDHIEKVISGFDPEHQDIQAMW